MQTIQKIQARLRALLLLVLLVSPGISVSADVFAVEPRDIAKRVAAIALAADDAREQTELPAEVRVAVAELKHYYAPERWRSILDIYKTTNDNVALTHLLTQLSWGSTLATFEVVSSTEHGDKAMVIARATLKDGTIVQGDKTFFSRINGRWYIDY